jgi:hypothetical protein
LVVWIPLTRRRSSWMVKGDVFVVAITVGRGCTIYLTTSGPTWRVIRNNQRKPLGLAAGNESSVGTREFPQEITWLSPRESRNKSRVLSNGSDVDKTRKVGNTLIFLSYIWFGSRKFLPPLFDKTNLDNCKVLWLESPFWLVRGNLRKGMVGLSLLHVSINLSSEEKSISSGDGGWSWQRTAWEGGERYEDLNWIQSSRIYPGRKIFSAISFMERPRERLEVPR